MRQFLKKGEPALVFQHLVKWTLIALPMALGVGSLVALFLWLLEEATNLRYQYPALLYLLPFAGVVIYALYKYLGQGTEAGNNLILDQIHDPSGGIPFRMAPLVLLTTIGTHLFGGSVGREGTAVQIGGSISYYVGKKFKLNPADIQIIVLCGMAAGFGAVFGTPVTGAVFALEVIAIGAIRYHALVPCFITAVLADAVCSAWGIQHTQYQINFQKTAFNLTSFLRSDYLLLIKVIGAGVAFGLVAQLFARATHAIRNLSNQYISVKWLIPALGGGMIIGLTFLLGTQDYLGLGVVPPPNGTVSITTAFEPGGATTFSWFWKLLFTAITLGAGFKGGEVTPLFFVGATLGHTLAVLTGAPIDLMAGLGFIAVFAGATNTPLACTLMGVELFGGAPILYYAVACFTAYYFSGHQGIYAAQRLATHKFLHSSGKEENSGNKAAGK
ncbi:voltage-gated chloride channel family protein [Adhaeribacter pallidiroseus]|uniref:Chloride/fluoride channel protein n=1 Tax=Adhaeribacter pallidiroseus TaxID=2072847 RepID=A0A369QFZ6_9BACT|nr:voltage-gated chloride channel family protein [Adhaeribacter pallidiroseus]RDC62475.1 Chloride/fluoride channel protein [Adhaeribacter pallidiroseus]